MPIMDRDRWRVLEPLLDGVLDLAPDQRAAWLDDLRRQSPALASEVTSLLASELVADQAGFLARPHAVRLDAKLEGLELGAYTIERPLGQGGMGTVWLARRTDGRFEGQAAVKLLNLALLSPSGQARFRREGSVLARLTHPGIARLLDAGVTPSGQPYLVLEHIDGVTIDAFVRDRGLSLESRVRVFLKVLEPVGHAHANLIVHRDLKPSNILVTKDGTVKLLDFGIAKLLDSGATGEHTALTADAGVALTPEYAAPEQVRGEAITTATDVYSLGVLLYVLVAGRHPTAAGCRTPADAVRALFDVEPSLLGLGDLDTILNKALRKDPAERYQTVTAFADDLERYLRHEPVSARRNSILYRVRKFVRRHRVGLAATALTAAALVAATAFSLVQMNAARRQRDAAVFAGKRADAQVEFQSLLMSQLGNRPLTMREILDRGRGVLERQFATDPRFFASLLVQLSQRYTDLGESKIQRALLVRAESIAVAGRYAPELAEIRCNMSDELRTEGRYDDARRVLRSADSLLRVARDPEVEVTCLEMEANLNIEAGGGRSPVAPARRAIAIRDSLGKTSDMTYVDLTSTLAEALDSQDSLRPAIAMYHRADALMDSTGRGETMSSAVIEHNWATALSKLGQTAEAERRFHDVLERTKRSDPTGRLPAQALIHYAHVALFQADFDSARKYFGILATQATDDHNPYWAGRALFGLAQAELRSGRVGDGRRTMARFRPISVNPDLAHTDDQIVDYRILDGWLAAASGDSGAAQRHVTDALRTGGYFTGKRRRVFYSAMILAAETSLASGHATDALKFARDARAIVTMDSLSDTQSALVGEARLVEARALLATGDTAAGRATIERARTALTFGAGPHHPRTREAEQLLASLSSADR